MWPFRKKNLSDDQIIDAMHKLHDEGYPTDVNILKDGTTEFEVYDGLEPLEETKTKSLFAKLFGW